MRSSRRVVNAAYDELRICQGRPRFVAPPLKKPLTLGLSWYAASGMMARAFCITFSRILLPQIIAE